MTRPSRAKRPLVCLPCADGRHEDCRGALTADGKWGKKLRYLCPCATCYPPAEPTPPMITCCQLKTMPPETRQALEAVAAAVLKGLAP